MEVGREEEVNVKKVVLFAFNGEAMCFVHVLLNGLDMKEKGYEVRIVIEGAATKLIPYLSASGSILSGPYRKAKELGLIDGVCKACAGKMGTLTDVQAEGLALLDDMMGHPGMGRYRNDGYEVITF